MQESRIDHLRKSLAAIGEEQADYWAFFDPFSAQLEAELGAYLGDQSSVARAPFDGEFDFDRGSYRTSGLRFRNGKLVIPLMVRLRNLKDDGNTTIRIHLCCLLDKDCVVADFEGRPSVSVRRDNLEPLLKYIYEYLSAACSHAAWFEENPSAYRGTSIGFGRSGEAAP